MKKRQSGFTLLELSIVLLVVGLILGLSVQSVNTRRIQGEMEQVITEMQSLSHVAERARVLGGDHFVRQPTSVVAAFIKGAGGEAGSLSTTSAMVSPQQHQYLITTTGRVGVVEVDWDGLGVVPVGLTASNVGGRSRLLAAYRPPRAMHFAQGAYWDKRILYCEDHGVTDKPEHCP